MYLLTYLLQGADSFLRS